MTADTATTDSVSAGTSGSTSDEERPDSAPAADAGAGRGSVSRSVSGAGDGPGLISDSSRIAIASAMSRITGLLRIVVAASVFGSTVLGDLFVAINVLPLTLYDVFAGSAISSVLVPPLVRLLGGQTSTEGNAAARRFSANALGLICASMAVLATGAVLGRSLLSDALTAGVAAELRPDATAVAGTLLLLIIPQLVLYAAIGVFVSMQHARRRFLLPSAAPIVENVGLLVTIAVAWRRFGGGLEVDQAPLGLILTLAIGSGLSVSAHAVLQYVGARRAIGRIGLGLNWRHPDISALAGPTRSSFGWSSVIALRQFALVIAAGFAGAGGVQAFEIATLAYFIPVALIGRPIASAALPRLAGSTGGAASLLAGYRTTLRLAAWGAVPAGAALVLLSGPLADIIGQGRFSGPGATRMLTYAMAGLGLGAASDALFEIARQTTMAHGAGNGVARSTWIRAGVAVAGIPLVVLLLDGPPVLLGLGLTVSVGDLAALAVAHRALRKDPAWRRDRVRHWPRLLAASAIAVAPMVVVDRWLHPNWSPLTAPLLLAGVALPLMAAAWLTTGRGRMLRTLGQALRNEELS